MKSPIKTWMEQKGVTQHDMADRMGWSQPFLSDFVNGKHPEPVWHKIKKLQTVTGIDREVIEEWLQSILDEREADNLDSKPVQVKPSPIVKKKKSKKKKSKSKKSN